MTKAAVRNIVLRVNTFFGYHIKYCVRSHWAPPVNLPLQSPLTCKPDAKLLKLLHFGLDFPPRLKFHPFPTVNVGLRFRGADSGSCRFTLGLKLLQMQAEDPGQQDPIICRSRHEILTPQSRKRSAPWLPRQILSISHCFDSIQLNLVDGLWKHDCFVLIVPSGHQVRWHFRVFSSFYINKFVLIGLTPYLL